MIKQDFASPGEKKTPIQANTGTFSRIDELYDLGKMDKWIRRLEMGKINIKGKERILTKSRIMEYFTVDGLVKMIGVESSKFDIYILKELVDNALDACELTDKPPDISIEINSDLFLKDEQREKIKECIIHIKVKDEGPGISKEALEEITNFQRFGGTKYFVKKPTRGAQGNALNVKRMKP